MRILIVDTCYPAFLAAHYARTPELIDRTYDEQWRALMDSFFGTADSFSHHLAQLGHPAHEFVVNCDELATRWAVEHGVSRDHRARDDLLLRQAEAFEPDVCFVQNLETLQPQTLRTLSRRGHLLVGHASTEPPGRRRLRLFDLLVTPLPYLVDRFRALGIATEYLPLAFDSRVLSRLRSGDAHDRYGAVFVGSLKRFRRWKANRAVARAAGSVPIDFWGYGAGQWPRSSPVNQRYHGEAWGLDMYDVLAASRIAINRHGDITRGYACNMRLYEATGVGAMLLTDGVRNLESLFTPGTEVVRYRDEQELVRKIAYYLEADDERRAIARAGQLRTLSDHTYAQRMARLVEILGSQLGERKVA